jgi:phosphatidylethanolamine/phosphatidyl-N-methylethanolamine N-methyltransferase
MISESKLFLKLWLRSPLTMGALMPSSRGLAAAIARQVPKGKGPVIELGGGTGSITEALLESGIKPEDLYVIELDDELHGVLTRRFPGVHVVKGDASQLRTLLRSFKLPPARAVVSGLPLLSMKRSLQEAILDESFAMLPPGGDFIQFTYSLFSPVPRRELHLVGEPRATIVTNFPPARVWVFQRIGHNGKGNGKIAVKTGGRANGKANGRAQRRPARRRRAH